MSIEGAEFLQAIPTVSYEQEKFVADKADAVRRRLSVTYLDTAFASGALNMGWKPIGNHNVADRPVSFAGAQRPSD